MQHTKHPILLIQHAPHEHPAALRRVLVAQGIATRWIHPYRGDPYPDAHEIGGLVSLGGPMSSNDELENPWIINELKLIQRCLSRGLPILGICLGGQLLARATGKRVFSNPVAEVGWFPLKLTDAGNQDQVLSSTSLSPQVYHFHFETFEVPDGAQLLAGSDACERQAYRMGDNVYGLQFHPEADHQLLSEWISIGDFDAEIREIQGRFGKTTVQDATHQLSAASIAELESIPLITAFCGIFSGCRPDSSEANRNSWMHDPVREWTRIRIPVSVEVIGPDGTPLRITGAIERLFTVKTEEFLLVRGEDQLVWPIRLQDITAIRPASK